MIWIALGLFVINAVTGYLSGRYLDARQARSKGQTLAWGAALDTTAGIDILGFQHLGWIALPITVLGGTLGTWASLR